jgi:hypothetical protein
MGNTIITTSEICTYAMKYYFLQKTMLSYPSTARVLYYRLRQANFLFYMNIKMEVSLPHSVDFVHVGLLDHELTKVDKQL